jgi:hypothetical protein
MRISFHIRRVLLRLGPSPYTHQPNAKMFILDRRGVSYCFAEPPIFSETVTVDVLRRYDLILPTGSGCHRMRGPWTLRSSLGLAMMRASSICSVATRAISRCIPSFRNTSARGGLYFSQYGARTIRSSCLLAPRPSNATTRKPRFISSIPAAARGRADHPPFSRRRCRLRRASQKQCRHPGQPAPPLPSVHRTRSRKQCVCRW